MYYYQKLMTSVPWRDCVPSAFIDHNRNPRGSLAEQCKISLRPDGEPVLPDETLGQIARREAEAHLFTPEQAGAARPLSRCAMLPNRHCSLAQVASIVERPLTKPNCRSPSSTIARNRPRLPTQK